jgi:hypothetical protein
MRTGIVNLPLHYGSCPSWLFERMTKLARAIVEIIVYEYNKKTFLKKLADPFFFQSFGCVLGYDWHSSGLTTTVTAALKEGLRGLENDLGIYVCGGKGKTSRKTPWEIEQLANRYSFNASSLIYASKMSAKVDNSALQDGYQLYHHTFIFTKEGDWAVIQQGMNVRKSFARRYHWLNLEGEPKVPPSTRLGRAHPAGKVAAGAGIPPPFKRPFSFVCEPHSAIASERKEKRVLNMVAKESDKTRKISTLISREKPEKNIKDFKKIIEFSMPYEHKIRQIRPENLKRVLLKTYETKPENFENLLAVEGVGPKTIRALSLISELIYGAKPSYQDPAKFSFAHGGKDGIPYSINKNEYDKSIEILRSAIQHSHFDRREKLDAIRRLGIQ